MISILKAGGKFLRTVPVAFTCIHTAYAANFVVTSIADEGPRTLRYAILDANATTRRGHYQVRRQRTRDKLLLQLLSVGYGTLWILGWTRFQTDWKKSDFTSAI